MFFLSAAVFLWVRGGGCLVPHKGVFEPPEAPFERQGFLGRGAPPGGLPVPLGRGLFFWPGVKRGFLFWSQRMGCFPAPVTRAARATLFRGGWIWPSSINEQTACCSSWLRRSAPAGRPMKEGAAPGRRPATARGCESAARPPRASYSSTIGLRGHEPVLPRDRVPDRNGVCKRRRSWCKNRPVRCCIAPSSLSEKPGS